MSDRASYLSKSKLMSFRQCARRLYFEAFHPDFADESDNTQAMFERGHKVGDIAVHLYGNGAGTYVEYDQGLAAAIEQTRELMVQRPAQPIFEGTFQFDGVLVRVDVLLPDNGAWRIVEVKSSSKVKPEHHWDCAIQAWVFRSLGYPLSGVALAHIDTSYVCGGDGDYRGLLTEHDLTNDVEDLLPEVPLLVAEARGVLKAGTPLVDVGAHCARPYVCPFKRQCWPCDTRYPIQGLAGSKRALGELVAQGYRDITQVPAERLSTPAHARIHRVTVQGQPELLDGAAEFVASLQYPRYYLDFETIGPAIPIWAGTRPYETLPVQWSCHIERAPGDIAHAEFLDLSGEPPMRMLAEHMLQTLGTTGPVLMYTAYEKTVIEALAVRFPDLSEKLMAVIDRLVDLAPVARSNYYHPDMLGSWSIKAVIPTIDPAMNYALLEGINQGQVASAGYLEAIDLQTNPERRAQLDEQLRRYCRFDTEAMVRMVRFFGSGVTADIESSNAGRIG